MKKRLALVVLILAPVWACKPAARPAEVAERGPNATAVEVTRILGAGTAGELRPYCAGRMAEVVDEILRMLEDRRRFCDALLPTLEVAAERERVQRLRDLSGRKLIWSAPGIELEGLVDKSEDRGRYRVAAITADGHRSPRVMILERAAEGWRLVGFDEGPGLQAVINIRNQANQIHYLVDGLVREFGQQAPRRLDERSVQFLGALERLVGER
ncbi:MAG: hypothetical protein H6807_04755 [Planctomycetes bacterium]|nr:hypothetical protein [Planctomycetota bacterium]